MPGTAPGTLATTATRAAGDLEPGFFQYVKDILGQGKDAAGNATKATGKGLKAANAAILPGLAKNGLRIGAAGGILGLLSAGAEFADTDDPFMRNAAQAGGNLGGGLAGAGAGAALGTAILPGIGTVAGGVLGGMFGAGAGSNIAGGLYDTITDVSPEDRARQQAIKQANLNNKLALQQAATQRQIMVDDLQARIPLMKDVMAMKRADDMQRAERDLRINNDYNYANALNQALLNAQAQRGTQELALTQYMMN